MNPRSRRPKRTIDRLFLEELDGVHAYGAINWQAAA